MNPLSTARPEPIDDGLRHHRKHNLPRKPTDIKIHDFILSRIALPGLKEGSLLATATAPHVVIPASLVTKQKDREANIQMPRRRRPVLIPRRTAALPSKYCPIGLEPSEPHNWINALMQFLLFIPTLREIFAYTPQSLYSFNAFIDQYFVDVEEKRVLSRADSNELVRCLIGKFPHLFKYVGVANLHEIIQAISQSACTLTSLADAGFRPEWQILWDPEQDLMLHEVLKQTIVPPELLIALKLLYDPAMRKKPQQLFCRSLQRQYFSSHTTASYELDAFIEHRTEEGAAGDYFTYLKIDGTWMQCADERIIALRRSTSLDLPLRRGILFHYRRVLIGSNFGLV